MQLEFIHIVMQNNSNNKQIQMRKQTSIITNNHYHTKRSPSPISLSPHKHLNHQKQKQQQQAKNSNLSIMSPVQKLSLSNNNSAISGITNNQMTPESMSKIITMMRQQIQTSNNFYVNKMKKLVQDQAKEICALRDRIVQNQRDLILKTNIIDQMRHSAQKQRDTTPKKKISVISSQPEQLNNQSMQQLSQKINQLQQKLTLLEQNMSQKHQSQKQMNIKVEQLEKGTIKYFASKLAGYQSKLDKYLIKKQQEIEKLYGDFKYYVRMGEDNGFFVSKNTIMQKSIVNNLSSTQNMTVSSHKNLLSNSTINKQSPIQNLGKKLLKLTNELQQLRGQLIEIKEKEYHYDNHQVQILKENINKIRKYIDIHSSSNKELSRNDARHTVGQPIQMNSQKIIRNQQSNQNLNAIKSQKLINTQQQTYIPQQKQINSINTITNRQNLYSTPLNSQSSYLTSVIPQSAHQNSTKSKQKLPTPTQSTKSIYLNNNHRQDMNDINMLNLSTPAVYHHQQGYSNYNTNQSISNKNISQAEPVKSYYISPNYNSNNSTKTVVKTINLTETSVSSYMNDHANTNKYKNASNPTNNNNKHINLFKPFEEEPQTSRNQHTHKQKTLQNQFYDQNSAGNKKQHQHSQGQCQQQSIEYEQQSSFNQYEEQQSLQLVQVNNIDRLINTIKDHKMPMPVYVQIDQTGYLKCIKNGMYLVDSNDDGFQLLDEQVRQLTNKQIIKLAANTVYHAANSSNHSRSYR